ncbi:hypothetical protein Nepgr_026402 [Nepenthes gracilis]|uniref:Potassium transporter n=1 Tax=Nepenthes gracilis TaxID=150966 RepID=A0AAD3T8Y9_NEPGR|nr:hypothetical protein Nepgr_026402 [Nepenthes gracilis]
MGERGVAEVDGIRRDLSGRKSASRFDSMNLETGNFIHAHHQTHSSKGDWMRTLSLAFQSVGVIYGDLGTSPLYVYSSTFPEGIKHRDDVVGALSIIIYTMLLLPMIKYVFIILWANDNGDGGTFALYSLLCRHAKVSMIPNQQPEDMELSNYKLEVPSNQSKRAAKIREMLENSKMAQRILFLVTILGTSMVMGDGVLTPSISVLSAMGGIQSLGTDAVVWISVAILIFLFAGQRFGTDKVGLTFAPILSVWFLFITGIGFYNLFKHDIGVLRAFYPKYIFDYFRRNGKRGWISLGGIFLCLTGTEAMFADLGHFNVRAVQISFSTVVYPSVIVAYIGQAAYLTKFPDQVSKTFYASIPDPLYWPMFVVAAVSAIIASQALISGAFAIISQSQSLGCFPKVKVIHTSAKYEGQVYIPEINYILMIACVLVTLGFKTTDKIGNAFGIAVCFVMVITTCMVTLIMLVVWKTSIWKIALFFILFGLIELVYLSASLYKFTEGGYLPLLFSLLLMTIMGIWHYVHRRRYAYELENKVSSDSMIELVKQPKINRVPGIGLLYSELVHGIPPIFRHFIDNMPSVYSIVIFITVKHLPVSKVALEERFMFRQIEPRQYRMFRCVLRLGYNDIYQEPNEFEWHLVERLVEFIQQENLGLDPVHDDAGERNSEGTEVEEEVRFVQAAMAEGVVYMLGEAKVIAKKDSSLLKKIVVNYVYDFLRRNVRQGEDVMEIPHGRLLAVGMTYEI